ncbi:MAG TPA: N-acetyltransferase [Pseudonocardiaceae bacterium]|jgi:GNAT superfamily N-acetyltransferase
MTSVIAETDRGPAGVGIAPASEAAVDALVRACSPGSLRRRFFLPADPDPADVLARYHRYLLASSPREVAVVALMRGLPVGLLNLAVLADGLVEAGVLVADAWQRRGVAGLLIATELGSGRWAGWTVRATVQPDNRAMRELLRGQRIGVCRLVGIDRAQLDYDIALPPTGETGPGREETWTSASSVSA